MLWRGWRGGAGVLRVLPMSPGWAQGGGLGCSPPPPPPGAPGLGMLPAGMQQLLSPLVPSRGSGPAAQPGPWSRCRPRPGALGWPGTPFHKHEANPPPRQSHPDPPAMVAAQQSPLPPGAPGSPPRGSAPYLLGREDGDVVLVDHPGLLVDGVLVALGLELLARQPEEHVLLAVLSPQELPEDVATRRALHQLVEGLCPAPHLLRCGFGAAGSRGEGKGAALRPAPEGCPLHPTPRGPAHPWSHPGGTAPERIPPAHAEAVPAQAPLIGGLQRLLLGSVPAPLCQAGAWAWCQLNRPLRCVLVLVSHQPEGEQEPLPCSPGAARGREAAPQQTLITC